MSQWTQAQIEAIDAIAQDWIAFIIECRANRSVDFLTDEQRQAVKDALDNITDAEKKYNAVLDAIEDAVDNKAADEYLAGLNNPT